MIGERKQARLEKWATVKDSSGHNVESIVQKSNVWVEIIRQGGDRSSLNGKTGLTNMYQFRFRYASIDKIDITGNWRLVYDRRYFKVHSIEKEHQNRFYYIIKAESIGPR